MCSDVAEPQSTGQRRRGDKHRQAIIQAVRDLLEERPFAELSVSAISRRAGVARSGFYFYFDSKYAVLAEILDEGTQELHELTQYLAPRQPEESPELFAKRMVDSAAAVYAHIDPVMSACMASRHTDEKIREILMQQYEPMLDGVVAIIDAELKSGAAKPISDDIPALVRILAGTSTLIIANEPYLVSRDGQCDVDRGAQVVVQLWVHAIWGGGGGQS